MTAGKQLWRNRKEKKEWARRLQSEDPGLEVVHPHAAGIDAGNSTHYAAVRPDRDPEPVRRFECLTADLHRLADWLQSCGKDSSHVVDWRLLDSAVRDSGRAWPRGLSGQCTAYQESSGAQERRAGEPVVAEVAHLWATEQLLPTRVRDSGATNLLAATRRTRAGRGDLHPADAKDPHADERAIGKRDQ